MRLSFVFLALFLPIVAFSSPNSAAMHPNAELITQFYTAFQNKDFKTMGDAYHDEAKFKDPVFNLETAQKARAMWHYLVLNGKDLRVEFKDVKADDNQGTAHWEAWYTFSATGRKVHNIIEASFEFKDGKIFRHQDKFGLWKWTRMALGTPGILLGWTPIVTNKVRQTAVKSLRKFMAEQPEYK